MRSCYRHQEKKTAENDKVYLEAIEEMALLLLVVRNGEVSAVISESTGLKLSLTDREMANPFRLM
ncbi:hypothetical protein ACSAZK_06910 [Methanosarcina sp. Mfa9]|uniref:hypothetical protein n=1 Tax=Methanosarcina sp. Mfa9 TaxID=3439063 RepID=UPI003F848C74